MDDLDLDVHGIAGGGDGVATAPDGRVVFVTGAIPGDRVRARLVDERARFARGVVVEVVSPGAGRIEPPCPHVEEGCGGCGWQHVDPVVQRTLKATIVADALRRIGKIADAPEVRLGPELAAEGYRTTVRGLVAGGRFAFRRAGSHDPVAADGCLTAHPLVREVIDEARFPAAREVMVRAGAATGERVVVLDPRLQGVTVPEGVMVAGKGEPAAIHDDVAGRRWRISARSFFQARPDGAAALVDVVAAELAPHLGATTRLVDLYSGVGLFAGTIGAEVGSVVAVEGDRSAVADAKANLGDLGGRVRVVHADVGRWQPNRADVVIADPSRAGLGADVVGRIVASGAHSVALVSCDAGAFGRDAGLLVAAGYELRTVTLVDLFPQTPHIEVVARFETSAEGIGTEHGSSG